MDGSWRTGGFAAEIISTVSEKAFGFLKNAPVRIAFPDAPTPTGWAMANHYYPRAVHIVNSVREMFGEKAVSEEHAESSCHVPLDVPDKAFTGPF